jgi:hypothetical protein
MNVYSGAAIPAFRCHVQYESGTINEARGGRHSILKEFIIFILLNIIKVIKLWENVKLSLREIGWTVLM